MKQGDFTEVAKHYHNRPAYSVMLLDKLIKCVNDTNKPLDKLRVVEVGAGTGKLTKILADDFGMNIRAVEPNDSMREEGKNYTKDSNISWCKGSGENTGIESSSADWVIMASSFHWTDPKKSLPEFARILDDNYYYNAAYANNADNGGGGANPMKSLSTQSKTMKNTTTQNKAAYFTAIWNPRHIAEGSIFHEIETEIKNIVPELTRVSSGTQNVKKWEEILVSTGHFKDCFFMECDYLEVMSKERYLGAWHSVNDIQAQAGQKRWQQILSMIESKIANLDEIAIPYKIRAWSVRKA
ncbi:class I SAM-dependent methyltransferase [Helicobacter bilis]|uniref:class I SAM-dependent methyltransferase n=1 Tax=Helicobacter bilis TaxID=37372 RepID=UPI000CF0135D|nr:class I SAM-dependent methyltransferase [Helicobacter bilis]